MVKRILLMVLLLLVVFGGIFGWKYKQMQAQEAARNAPQPPATVTAAAVEPRTWQPALKAVGSLSANEGIDVSSEVAGKVARIDFESGQRVRKGDLLVQLDDAVDQADLEGAIAEQRLAQLQFRRMKQLFDDRTISRAELDQARAELDRAGAEVASKKSLVAKKAIRAPFAGLLGIRQVDVGQYLSPGTAMVRLESLNPIYADYALPERHLARLHEGQPVRVTVQAFPGEPFEGQVLALDARVDRSSRSIHIRAGLDNPGGRLRPGMFAEIRTLLPERRHVLTLPRTAITYAPYGDSVFMIEQTGEGTVARRRRVETGEVRGGDVEIVRGLQEGDRVVAAGQVKLRDGQPVAVTEGGPPGQAAQ